MLVTFVEDVLLSVNENVNPKILKKGKRISRIFIILAYLVIFLKKTAKLVRDWLLL